MVDTTLANIKEVGGDNGGGMDARRWKLVVALTVVVGGVVFLMAGKLKDAFRYSETVAAVANAGDSLVGRPLRIQARYVNDSLEKKREGGKPFYEFQIHEADARLKVRYDDALPDTLVNGAEVTAEGSLARKGYFHATKVFAKCPSKYDAAQVPAGYRPPDPYQAAGRSVPSAPAAPRAGHPSNIPMPGAPAGSPQ
jgi:cytochrome c-type biogenesis protein CcmE